MGGAVRRAPIHERELLGAVWEAVNVGRDNKALAIVRDGTICNINALAAQLCERPSSELIGKSCRRPPGGGIAATEVSRQ